MPQILATPQILTTTKTNAKDVALVAFGVPVVLLDRVSDQLNTRLDLDSYLELARERGERALDGYGKQVHGVTRRVRSVVHPVVMVGSKLAAPVYHAAGRLVPDPIEARMSATLASAKHLVDGVAEQIAPSKTKPVVTTPGPTSAAAAPKKTSVKKAAAKKSGAKKASR